MFDFTRTNLSKEAIASRMFRQAARNWGLNDTNMDNFDPLVRLLIEVCAVEIYRIDNEISSLQKGITERLASLLTPEVYIQPRPSHAVIHACSSDESAYVSPTLQFLYHKKVPSVPNGPLDANMDVFFSPAGKYKTLEGDVRIIATNANVYKVNGLQQKEIFLKTLSGKALPKQTVWVGLDARRQQNITDISLFFDLKNTPDKGRLLSMLPYIKCTCSGRAVHLKKGLSENSIADGVSAFENSLEELHINRRLENSICRTYNNHFMTITQENHFLQNLEEGILSPYPPEFEQLLGAAELKQLPQKLLWFQLSFPPEFTAEVLDDLTIAINCFPVANRHLNRINYRLNSYFNIIPLLSSEQFFSVHSVEGTIVGSTGRMDYSFYPFDRYNPAEKGNYTVRSGDLQRFDSRNAAEYLNYLIELLRDESRAFAAFGQDFIASTIKDLNQNIGLIEQKVKQNLSLLNTAPAYLLINPLQEGDTIFVQYWTCNGEAGNNIRSGSKMDLYEGSSIKKEGLILMTQTSGGMDRLKNTEILKAFKSVLISRNRIITAEDIKNFCFYYLQNKAEDVKVQRGVGISPMPDQGLMPVINIIINPREGFVATDTEWEGIKAELLSALENESPSDANYVISVN